MVNLLTKICIVATCAMMVVAAPSGSPVSAPAEAADCSSLVFDLIDCMDFLVAGGNETAPDRSCCLGFKSLLVANEDCMCYALGTAAGLGLDINMTRAEALPSDCRISSPPIATCHANSPIISAPIHPPAAAPAHGGSPSLTSSAAAPALLLILIFLIILS
ncbi:hypothetical protein ACS0TY_013286 [Phlomoides rotata]